MAGAGTSEQEPDNKRRLYAAFELNVATAKTATLSEVLIDRGRFGMGRRRLVRVDTIFKHFLAAMVVLVLLLAPGAQSRSADDLGTAKSSRDRIAENAVDLVSQGGQIFRFDTFGDQAFWGDVLRLHEAIEGAGLGGVGPGVSPKEVLALGLKVDVGALPRPLLDQIRTGRVNLNDPAVTLQL